MKPSSVYAFLIVCILVVAGFGILQTYSLQQTQSDLNASRAQVQEKANTSAQLQLSLNEQISSLTTSMDSLQAQLNASQETIQSQAVTISNQTSQIADLQNQITGLNDQVSSHISLSVTGLVQGSLYLTLSDLVAMPWTTVNATLYCVGSPSTAIAGGNWTGVSLASILQRANVSTTAIKIAFYATDGYSTDLTLATGMQNDIIVAFENNGVPLTGLRLVTPGLWGYKWINDLADINLVDYNFLGTWESQGYSDPGVIG